jgi:hypothetical protein
LSDVDYQPANDTPATPPPELVGTPIEERISNPIDTGKGDEANLRAATEELRKRREKDWESGAISDDAFAEQRAPVLERRYDKGHGAKKLLEATKDLTDAHREESPSCSGPQRREESILRRCANW